MIKSILAALTVLACLASAMGQGRFHVQAAEFDIHARRTVLRRLQFCLDCGSALLVTRVRSGVAVRCPDCGKEQPRLADKYLLTQMYQLCRLCESPLNSEGRHAGDVAECDNCHTRQILSPDVFPAGENVSGLGYAPGFPPGSGKKNLLYSPERPDAAITPIPLDDDGEDLAFAGPVPGFVPIPRPPVSARRPDSQPAPVQKSPGQWVPSPGASPRQTEAIRRADSGSPPRAAPELPRLPPPMPRASDSPAGPGSDPIIATIREPAAPAAVEVPTVSVDMFGGPKARAAAPSMPSAVPNELVARVDGTPIFAADVERVASTALARWREQAASGGAPVTPEREKALRREILERLIDRELAVREAAALGLRPDPAVVRSREAALSAVAAGSGMDVRREAERDVVMADMRRIFGERPAAASPEAVRDFYRGHRDELTRPRQLAISQLVVYRERASRRDKRGFQEIAKEISGKLESGARFDDLRLKYDEFPDAAGAPSPEPALLPENAFAGQILASAGHLRAGAVFGPVMLDGMALFGKVMDERPEGPIPFEEAEKDIRVRLERETAERNFENWLKRLRQRGVVELYLND